MRVGDAYVSSYITYSSQNIIGPLQTSPAFIIPKNPKMGNVIFMKKIPPPVNLTEVWVTIRYISHIGGETKVSVFFQMDMLAIY
jgi:hypothetical protein